MARRTHSASIEASTTYADGDAGASRSDLAVRALRRIALVFVLMPLGLLPAAPGIGSAAEDPGGTGGSSGVADALAAGAWTLTAPMSAPRRGLSLTPLLDGRVLAYGAGGNDTSAPASGLTESYASATGQWQLHASSRPPRRRHCAAPLSDGRVLAVGGDGGPGQPFLGEALIYDPSTEAWTTTGTLGVPRASCTATTLADGRVAVVGGGKPGFVSEIEIFDPATGQFTQVGLLNEAREYHTVTQVSDGRLIVIGGAGVGGRLSSVEVVDLASGASTLLGQLETPRAFHTATLLEDGQVLVAGGDGGGGDGFPPKAELLDPSTGNLTTVGALGVPRRYHTATRLDDGRILVAGGDRNAPLDSVEIYDPETASWSAGASLNEARSWHAAALLPDGGVLIAGGRGAAGDLASAELFAAEPPDESPLCAEPPAGLIGWWAMDETEGDIAVDEAGGHDGAYVGGPAVVAQGYVGPARRFDGAGQHVQVPHASDGSLDFGTGDLSIDAWVRLDADAVGVHTLLDKRSFAPTRGFALFAIGGNLALQLADGSAPGNTCGPDPSVSPCTNYNSGLAIADGEWHFVAVSVDRDGEGTFRVDGQSSTFSAAARSGSLDNDAPLYIGRHAQGGAMWKGDLDEVELFRGALLEQELDAIHGAGPAGKCRAAQPEEPFGEQSLQQAIDETFAPLDASQMPAGILLDKTVLLSRLSATAELTDTVYTNDEWRQIYRELYNGSLDREAAMPPEDVNEIADVYAAGGRVPIGLLHRQVSRLVPDALERDLIELREGQLHDLPARSESPYTAETVSAAAALVDVVLGPEVTFIVPELLVHVDGAPSTLSLEIDFDDGRGPVEVAADSELTVRYEDLPPAPSTTTKRLTLTASVPAGQTADRAQGRRQLGPIEVEMALSIALPLHPQATIERLYFDVSSSDPQPPPYHGTARVTLRKASSSSCRAKPIVFVEGIDFGGIGHVSKPTFFSQAQWDAILSDYAIKPRGDIHYELLSAGGGSTYPEFAKAPELFDDLEAKGHDVLYVDFWDGAADIKQNAAVVRRILEHTAKNLCAGDHTTVIGASMGGLVARYALATMEQAGTPHCARTYVSFDAPHQGANIPLGAQAFIHFFKDLSDQASEAKVKLRRMAAQQLLIHHFDQDAGPVRVQWHKDLTSAGHADLLRRISVPSGSTEGKVLPFSQGAPIIKLGPYQIILGLGVSARAYAMPGAGGSTSTPGLTFHGWYKKGVFQPLVTDTLYSVGTPIDNAPGGTTDVLKAFQQKFLGLWIVWAESATSFIPTASALDYAPGMTDPHAAIPLDAQTPFADYLRNTGANQAHVLITDDNKTYLYDQLALAETLGGIPPQLITSASFNYGHQLDTLSHSVTVGNQGVLSVNGEGPTDGGAGPVPLAGSDFHVQVTDGAACNAGPTSLTVESGGRLELGSPDRSGQLTLGSGTTLRLRDGASLRVHHQSRLTIEPGATLVFEQGAQIQLVDDASALVIDGLTELGDDAMFTFSGKGHIDFGASGGSETVKVGAGASMVFQGSGKGDKVLGVSGLLWPEDHLRMFSVNNGAVELDGEIRLGGRYRFVNALLDGDGTLTSFGHPGSTISGSTFQGVGIAALLDSSGGHLLVSTSDFVGTPYPLMLYGGSFTFDRVTISDAAVGIYTLARTKASYLLGSSITDTAQEGIWEEMGSATAPLTIRDSTIRSASFAAIRAEGSALVLRRSSVHGATEGIVLEFGAQLDMSTVGGAAGCNDLSYDPKSASTLLELNQAGSLFLDAGRNRLHNGPHAIDFKDKKGGPILKGSFGGSLGSCTLSATQNLWSASDPSAMPQTFQKLQIELGSFDCPNLTVQDALPTDDPCPADGTPDPGPWSGKASALHVCDGCPALDTPDFPGVSYNDAIRQAMSRLARGEDDPEKDDLLAIRQLQQILTTPADVASPDVAWLRTYALRLLGEGVGSALATGAITSTAEAPLSEPIVQLREAYAFLAEPGNTPDTAERFGYALGRALALRQVGRPAEALAELDEIQTADLGPAERVTLERWQAQIAAEERLAAGELSPEDFRALRPPARPEPPSSNAAYLPIATRP